MAKKIKSLQDLKDRATQEDGCECFIGLVGGMKSSKQIWYFPEMDKWEVHNDIDESHLVDMTMEALMAETNIIEALNKGALYAY